MLRWFNKKNLVKKTNQNDLVKTVGSKSICPKWHFGQVGHGHKKTMISYSVGRRVFLKARPNITIGLNKLPITTGEVLNATTTVRLIE